MSTVTAPETPISLLYRYSTWLHVGPGAEECEAVNEGAGSNQCSNPLHFHAWCRLPNQYQHRDIREKALAGKARRLRALRDPDSDVAVIMEQEIEALAHQGDAAIPDIVEELTAKDWWRDYIEASQDVREIEDDRGVKTFEHIDADMERWRELAAKPEDERGADFAALEEHISAYNTAVDARREEIAKPRREALAARDLNALLDMLSDQRLDAEANGVYLHEYATLEWLTCTLRYPGGPEVFASRDQLERASDEVIEALKATYVDLEKTQNAETSMGGAPGNS